MCPPVKGAEVQAGVDVETSRNIAWLHVTVYCHLPCRELGTAGMLTLAVGAHTALLLHDGFWTEKLRCVVITTCQPSVLPV